MFEIAFFLWNGSLLVSLRTSKRQKTCGLIWNGTGCDGPFLRVELLSSPVRKRNAVKSTSRSSPHENLLAIENLTLAFTIVPRGLAPTAEFGGLDDS